MPNMKVTTYSERKESGGQWRQEALNADHIMPGVVFLVAAAFAADFTDAASGRIVIPDGTLIGRTYAERDAELGYGPADVVNDDQIFLMTRYISDAMEADETELYRHDRLVAENFLPNYANLIGTPELDWIRENYHCYIGAD